MPLIIPGAPGTEGARRSVRLWMLGGGRELPRLRRAPGNEAVRYTIRSRRSFALRGRSESVRVLTLGGLPPDTHIIAELPDPAGGRGAECRFVTLPRRGDPLRILLGSCYHRTRDRGRLSTAFASVAPPPHLKILCGDQLYTDIPPPPAKLPMDRVREEAVDRYLDAWASEHDHPFFRIGCTVMGADDHEFWNNFPHNQAFFWQHTGSKRGRDRWRRACERLFRVFQSALNPGGAAWFSLDLCGLPLFMTDLRTERQRNPHRDGPRARCMSPEQLTALLDWERTRRGPGLLVLGQPFLQGPGSGVDWNLRAYPAQANAVERLVDGARHDLLILSGDIHAGRLTKWTAPRGGATIRELVSSPLALVKPTATPRHYVAAPAEFKEAYPDLRTLWGCKEDHFALLTIKPGERGWSVLTRSIDTRSGEVVRAVKQFDNRACRSRFVLSR